MDLSIIDTLLVAPLAPLAGLLIFWSIQVLLSESLKYLLRRIWKRHTALCRFSNFIALLFQSISRMLGYTLIGIGVGEFSLSVSQANVSPKRNKEGFPKWFAELFLSIMPSFIPPMIVFLILLPFLRIYDVPLPGGVCDFSACLISFGSLLQFFGMRFMMFLMNLDFFNPFHLMFGLLFLLIGLGTRPSFIGEEERKVSVKDDLIRIGSVMAAHPLFIVLLFALLYIVYYLSILLKIRIYILLFSFLGWLSIIAILSLLFAHLFVSIIIFSDKLPSYRRFLPFTILVVSYITYRFAFLFFKFRYDLPLSSLLCILTTILFSILMFRQETNKLKIREDMARIIEVEDEDIER